MSVALLVVSVTVLGLSRLLGAHARLLDGLDDWCRGSPTFYVAPSSDADLRACGVAASLLEEPPEAPEAPETPEPVNDVTIEALERGLSPSRVTVTLRVVERVPPERRRRAPRGRTTRALRRPRRSRRRVGGYTMVDILAASALLGIFASVAVGAARFVGVATSSLRDRARAASELRMAVEYLREDLGGAVTVEAVDDTTVRILREETVARLAGAWISGADAGVEYAADGGRLVRRDLATDTSVVAALGITEFDVEEPAADEVTIRISAGTGSEEHAVTLAWRVP